jgi:hypothetical protein
MDAAQTRSHDQSADPRGDIPPKDCACGDGLCNVKTSNTQRNPNRRFYSCPGSCSFFEWFDPPTIAPTAGGASGPGAAPPPKVMARQSADTCYKCNQERPLHPLYRNCIFGIDGRFVPPGRPLGFQMPKCRGGRASSWLPEKFRWGVRGWRWRRWQLLQVQWHGALGTGLPKPVIRTP